MNIFKNIKHIKLINLLVIIPVLILSPLFFPNSTFAANKTSIELNLNYEADSNGKLYENYSTKYTNNIPNTVLGFSTEGKFILQTLRKYTDSNAMWDVLNQELNSLNLKINNVKKNFKYTKSATGYDISYVQNYTIKYGEKLTVSWNFLNPELIEKIGKIYNIYIPESPEVSTNSLSNYNITVVSTANVSEDLGPIYFATENHTISGNDYVFNFETKSSSKKNHVIQIGNSQIWKFNLVENVDLEGLSSPNLAEYKLIIPSDDASLSQKVFFENFSPEPQKIERLDNGDLVATYYLDGSVKSISVKGYLMQSETDFPTSSFQSENIDLTKYLASEVYWEVDDPLIAKTASEIPNGSSTTETIFNVYDFVIGKVDYDNLKLGINNIRQGAVRTLINGSGVCMEYSDLLITLLKAKGIPSRAVFGYGYTPGGSNGETDKHQWVQAYVDSTGWVSIDPTWGSTTRKFIGKDFDHFSWFVSNESVVTPEEVTLLWPGNHNNSLENPNIEVEPIGNDLDTAKLLTMNEITNKYSLPLQEQLMYDSRVLIYFPYLIGVILVLITIVILSNIKRKVKNS